MTYKEARAILPLEHICNEFARQKALEALDKQIPKKPTPKIEGAYGSVSCDEDLFPLAVICGMRVKRRIALTVAQK